MEFEIIWRDLQDDSRIVQKVVEGGLQTIEEARAYAAEMASTWTWNDVDYGDGVCEVVAVLPLPTEQQQEDAALALHFQLYNAHLERFNRGPTGEAARAQRREIQQSVQDDLFFADERVGTAFFMGLDTLLVLTEG